MPLLTRETILDALARLLGLRSSDEVLRVVLAYFPAERLPLRTRLLLEEMFDDGA